MPFLKCFKINLASLLVLWGLVVDSGIVFLELHTASPGHAGISRAGWPEGSLIRRVDGRTTLVIFLDPQCPCSRASLAELAQIMSRCNGRFSGHAVLCLPAENPGRWGESAIEHDLAEIPEVRAREDRGGLEAHRFGVSTSGHVLLYDAGGRLTFSGGITASRGQRGDRYGRNAVLARIPGQEGEGDRPRPPVFECSLVTPRPPAIQEWPR